jgi:hypothetical protein
LRKPELDADAGRARGSERLAMMSGETARKVGEVVANVSLRFAIRQLGGDYAEYALDLVSEVSKALAGDGSERESGAANSVSPSDIVAVMRSMSPSDIGRSIDAALAEPDMRVLTASMTSGEKESLKQRAVAEMSAFDRLYREMDAEEAREAAERLEKKRREIERKRQEKEAERLRKEAALREQLAPLKAQLMESLAKRDYEAARTHADAILAIAPTDPDALGADLRIEKKLNDRFKRAWGNFASNLQPLVAVVVLSRVAGCWQMRDWNAPLGSGPVYREEVPWAVFLVLLGLAFVYSFVGTYLGWPMFRWWHLRKRQ